ncbi:FAD:protein FMN transferase [Sulfurimonas sp.]
MFKAALLLVIFLVGSIDAQLVSRMQVIMGTFVTLSVVSKDVKYLQPTFRLLKNIEKSLSSYDKDSPIYKLNRDGHALLNTYCYEALVLSEKYYLQSDGYFNIAIGSVTKDAYDFTQTLRVPSSKRTNNSKVNFKALRFDENEAYLGKGVKIDLGGMGKGYGVDKAIEFLQKNRVSLAKVALSGDIRCIGRCQIEVNNPFVPSSLASFIIKDSGVSTSGNYNKYVKNVQYNHLINPKTKRSQQNFISITLISKLPNSDLDAYATAASVMPAKEAYAFLDSMKIAYIILDTNKKLHISSNIDKFTQELTVKYSSKE